ncbi:MAG: ATP-binding protein [Flavobacteriaceae bacterium]|nr:ATP-binding protein [Flavobacteriaceae bacterium]
MKIQEFSFENFRSFKEMQTLNLAASKKKSKYQKLNKNNVIQGENNENVSFLKSKAIYGANASGKSNVIKAMIAFCRIVEYSVKEEMILKNFIDSFKLSTETEEEPTFFQMIFWDKEVKYRYGFTATSEVIVSEWLYGKPGDREQVYFIREGNKIVSLNKTNFAEGNTMINLVNELEDDSAIFRSNSLLLTTLSSFGFGKLSKQLVSSISSILFINGLGQSGLRKQVNEALDDAVKKDFILKLLKLGDVGLQDVRAYDYKKEILPNELSDEDKETFLSNPYNKKILVSVKNKYNKENLTEPEFFHFDFDESEGTKKLLDWSPWIMDALLKEKTIVIDEFDARFHPLLTMKLVMLFNSMVNKGSQLIFCAHDTNLLSSDLMRRDQIDFVEKDKYEASYLYSLAEIKDVRKEDSFEKDYLQGKYGALPFLGDFETIIENQSYAQED